MSLSHNEVQLSREALISLLDDLSLLVLEEFGCQIRLFIHGGAVMILHPFLSTSSCRRTTRGIDYIRHAFGHEWRKRGVYDAEHRLQRCIDAVATKFQIGTDWMNADSDATLPFAKNSKGELYHPIYHDSRQPNNIEMNTVYNSASLVVISVTMFWGIALKLVRYEKEDPTDIVAMLRHETKLNGIQWTPHVMETWIKTLCWPMGYNLYKPHQADELHGRIHDAVRQLKTSPENSLLEEQSHTALIPSTALSPPVPSLHTMSTSLAPFSTFAQPQNAAFHGAQRYDEAIISHDIMLSDFDHYTNTHTREVRQQYVTSSEAAGAIQEVIHAQLEDTPHRLINTITGHLCNRGEQIIVFKTSPEYKKLLSSTLWRAGSDLLMEDISNAVGKYFRYVMLSHRWEENESLLRHIQNKDVYELDSVGGIIKLQSFCKTARDTGYRWAWIDTCCIDQTNNVEVQQSVNSMFVWYRRSALTIVYLSDVPPSSKSGALARSVWNKRGWTVQEFLAPTVVLFYHTDWTLYLNVRSLNHKDSALIMWELGDATGIDSQALVAFRPGMRGAREKLQWVSMRTTTLQEDIAYSLFGIFGIHLPVIYGENKQNALGRLLQEIVAKSGDITCLDWVGKPSEFNSCLPASITSYGARPFALLSPLSEDEIQTLVSLLWAAVDATLASRLYQKFESLNAPQFAASRLRLPCIAFAMTSVRRRRSEDQQSASTFAVKAVGLCDLLITTEDKLIPFSRAKPIRQSFLLVHPWNRSLFELHDFEDLSDIESTDVSSPPVSLLDDSSVGSLGEDELINSGSHSRALRLIVRLGQPFSALLLAQQPGGEYKRIASDQNIIAQVKDVTAVLNMDIRTVEIL